MSPHSPYELAASRLIKLARQKGILRASDATAVNVPRAVLGRMVENGDLVRLGRGLYVTAGTDLSGHAALALVQKRVPRGVICLLSALEFHGITTQAPAEVWVAIESKAWRPSVEYPPMRVIYASGEALEHGVETHTIDGQSVRLTSPAKTVADCFKYRNKIGLDVAIEALRDFRRKRGNMDALWRAAKADRVATVIRPYLEAIT